VLILRIRRSGTSRRGRSDWYSLSYSVIQLSQVEVDQEVFRTTPADFDLELAVEANMTRSSNGDDTTHGSHTTKDGSLIAIR
jgi:hypothetical protein